MRRVVSTRSLLFSSLRGLAVLVAAVLIWVGLAYFASGPLGKIYGWHGHPPIPGAPPHVYVLLFLVLLPTVSLFGAWWIVRYVRDRIRRSRIAEGQS